MATDRIKTHGRFVLSNCDHTSLTKRLPHARLSVVSKFAFTAQIDDIARRVYTLF